MPPSDIIHTSPKVKKKLMNINSRRSSARSIFVLLMPAALLFNLLMYILPIKDLHSVQAAPDVRPSLITVPAEMNKTFNPIAIAAGSVSKMRVSIFNLNANVLTDATWTDNMPAGILVNDPPNIVNTCGAVVDVTDMNDNPLIPGANSLKFRTYAVG
jgi:hypothetical protein